ncbi:hypothetical protein BKA93DRAFT_113104 [Sparassis latifolia]
MRRPISLRRSSSLERVSPSRPAPRRTLPPAHPPSGDVEAEVRGSTPSAEGGEARRETRGKVAREGDVWRCRRWLAGHGVVRASSGESSACFCGWRPAGVDAAPIRSRGPFLALAYLPDQMSRLLMFSFVRHFPSLLVLAGQLGSGLPTRIRNIPTGRVGESHIVTPSCEFRALRMGHTLYQNV